MKLSREQVIQTLRGLLPQLREEYGIEDLSLFGSMARGDYDEQSDVDLIAGFSRPIGWGIVSLEAMLEQRLARKVQVFHRRSLGHSQIADRIEKDMVAIQVA